MKRTVCGVDEDCLTAPQALHSYALRIPDATAVVAGTKSLNYGELHYNSSHIAARIQARVNQAARVGVLCGRNIHLLSSAMAVLKAGCAYVPLEVDMPRDRLSFIVNDAGLELLLVEEATLELAREIAPLASFLAVDEQAVIARSLEPVPIASDTLAYVIYTSGSTGEPKGVLVEHGGLAAFLGHMHRELQMRPADRVFAMASVSFDVSVFELLLPIYSGGTSVILPRFAAADPDLLMECMRTHEPRVVMSTPSTWQLLREAGWSGSPGLNCISGGEAFPPHLAAYLSERVLACWNHYGPTEATITALTHRIEGPSDAIPLGEPVAGLSVSILDERLQPVRPGESGELYISGSGVARGYLNRLEQTSSAFSSFTNADGTRCRMYRTGDLVRKEVDGSLYFAGRVDNQVKLRGFRIELEEIESLASQHAEVSRIAVVCRTMAADQRLIAYVVPANRQACLISGLREFLMQRLPAYMVPATFVIREVLPLTPNGKIDRAALMSEPLPDPAMAEGISEPADATEKAILDIWRKLPGFAGSKVTDRFAELGGHSMLAARLISTVSRKFGVKLSLSVLLEAPTVRDLAQVLRIGISKQAASGLVSIRVEGAGRPLFCIHGIEGNIFGFQALGSHMRAGRPIYAIEAKRLLDSRVRVFSIEELAREYIQAMRVVQKHGPYLISGYSAGGVVAFEIASQLSGTGEAVEAVVLFDATMYSRLTPGSGAPTRLVGAAVTRIRKFAGMELRLKLKSFRKNFTYYRMIAATKSEVKIFQFLQGVGLSVRNFFTFRAAFAHALQHYQPIRSDIAIDLLRAEIGDGSASSDVYMGWEGLADAVTVHNVPGEHFNLFTGLHVGDLCRTVDRILDGKVRGTQNPLASFADINVRG